MPMLRKGGEPRKSELPDTIARSDKHAQRTFAKAHDAAADEYGDGRRAHQTAYAALKHSYEKVGDHWERKNKGSRGPSDDQAAQGRGSRKKTAGGVDANASKEHLMDVARRLDIRGRSKMKKSELVSAIQKANARSSRS
ncbi:ChaB family protein [Microlunatus sp. Gsoil 973]|jgi:cation transport regulator ChaB|uniref:ChaB family protein n=1 Tax=Microlunatus sp. Gsoil 973 TaxID=2672569 RepID=UPI0012B4712A|nr:ChaB family protein [Microlunatus sp. Gsoil 973]QGN33529.1 cation transport regulator ChaB [Microlunatus sp. Gsoil 973]